MKNIIPPLDVILHYFIIELANKNIEKDNDCFLDRCLQGIINMWKPARQSDVTAKTILSDFFLYNSHL